MSAKTKAVLTALKWAVLTLAGVLLFITAKGAALEQRGYTAHGGEYLILPLPLWWWLIERCVGDFIRDIKAEFFSNNNFGGKRND